MEALATWQYLAIALIFVWSGFVRTSLGFGGADTAGVFPAAESVGDHPCHALRSQSILPIRRYHLPPRPAKTSSILGLPAKATIFAPAGRVGSPR